MNFNVLVAAILILIFFSSTLLDLKVLGARWVFKT
jgi:hypothetical protein